jgi:hypothetical protein
MAHIQSKQEIIRPTHTEVIGDELHITLSGISYSFKLSDISNHLASASLSARQNFVVSPSGYGIHWPDIDEDISIPALLKTNK